jgi:hypothetical protein
VKNLFQSFAFQIQLVPLHLGEALEKLTDMFLASGAPHEKLHPLELTHMQVMRRWPSEEKERRKLDKGEQEEKDRLLKVGGCDKLNAVETHSLKAPTFNPCKPTK